MYKDVISMPLTFSDEDLRYLDKQQDEQLRSIRQAVDDKKAKGYPIFCKKCSHLMQYFTVGNAKLYECDFCGNRVTDVIRL